MGHPSDQPGRKRKDITTCVLPVAVGNTRIWIWTDYYYATWIRNGIQYYSGGCPWSTKIGAACWGWSAKYVWSSFARGPAGSCCLLLVTSSTTCQI